MAILTSKGARAPHQLKGRRNVRVSRDRRGCGTDDIENLKTPAGTIQAYAGASAPQGYLLCQGQAISKSEYADLYLAIGDLYSNNETAEGFFNVPDLRDRFVQGANADNLGKNIEAGLPNITGSFKENFGWPYSTSDAFYIGSKTSTSISANIGSSVQNDVILDASRSSSIYGNSDTVQPPAVAINYIIKY